MTQTSSKPTKQKEPVMSLAFQLVSILLIFVLGVFIYFVFIPQLSALNALEESECQYVKHGLNVVDHCNPELENCFNFTVNVVYEQIHQHHHVHHSSSESLKVGESHKHEGAVRSPINYKTKEQVNQIVSDLQKRQNFVCYVDVRNPDNHILLERPPSSNLIASAAIIFLIGICAIYLLKEYVNNTLVSSKSGGKKPSDRKKTQ